MGTKVIRKKRGGEDLLGLVTLGSLITNLVQYGFQKSSEEQFKAHYRNMIKRYDQVSRAYSSMKQAKEGLAQEIRTLNDIIRELTKENNRLSKEIIRPKQQMPPGKTERGDK